MHHWSVMAQKDYVEAMSTTSACCYTQNRHAPPGIPASRKLISSACGNQTVAIHDMVLTTNYCSCKLNYSCTNIETIDVRTQKNSPEMIAQL